MDLSRDLGAPEGPVCLPDGSWLCVEMTAERGWVAHLSPDGRTKRVVARTGRPNGLAVDRHGSLWVAESSTPSLLRVTLDGRVEVFMTACGGEPFLFPNDLAFGPDGCLYMTDSGIQIQDFAPGGHIRPDWASVMPDGRLYRIDVHARKIWKLDQGLRFTNGIAFGPDNALYVNETLTGMVYYYPWKGAGDLGGRESFSNVVDFALPRAFRGPDGMKFGADGRLYVTVYGQGDVTVLSREGAVLQRIQTAGRRPTNVAFGLPGQKKLYVTEVERGALEVLDVDTEGWPLFMG